MIQRIAFMPIAAHPEILPDDSLSAAVRQAATLVSAVDVTAYTVTIPQNVTPFGSFLLDIPGLARGAEERSRKNAEHVEATVRAAAPTGLACTVTVKTVVLGAELDRATRTARGYDLAIVPWAAGTVSVTDMAQSLVFGSGRPTLLVPPTTTCDPVKHVAIAWDGSQVAARAMADALSLLPDTVRISILTAHDDKTLDGDQSQDSMVALLARRGYQVDAVRVAASGGDVAGALQKSALAAGAQILGLGGFGHSRLRDFVLGGVTKGVLSRLELPVLMSH